MHLLSAVYLMSDYVEVVNQTLLNFLYIKYILLKPFNTAVNKKCKCFKVQLFSLCVESFEPSHRNHYTTLTAWLSQRLWPGVTASANLHHP